MSQPSDIASAAQAVTEALRAACQNPADALRLLNQLAQFQPTAVDSSAPVGMAIMDMTFQLGCLFRRAAIASLARASADYQPSSYDDAAAVRDLVTAAIDAEIEVAGDNGQDASYAALRALRQSVVADLTSRGADLAHIKTFSFAAALPALTLAQQLYGDSSRAAELVTHADPVHPLFMPPVFAALAS